MRAWLPQVAVAIATAATLAGCDSPDKASDGNFRKAIDAHFKLHPECIQIPEGDNDFISKAARADPRLYVNLRRAGKDGDSHDKKIELDALASAGLMTVMRTDQADAEQNGSASLEPYDPATWANPRAISLHHVAIYALTPQGKAARDASDKTDPTSPESGHIAGPVCYGRRQVKEVENFTLGNMGTQVASVRYSYVIADRKAWARNAAVQAAYPAIAIDKAGPVKDNIGLLLTHKGWRGGQNE